MKTSGWGEVLRPGVSRPGFGQRLATVPRRWLWLAGILLAVLGAFIVFRGLSYGSGRSVVRVGDFQASVEEQRAIPTWVGGVAIVAGLLLVGASSVWRRTPGS